MSIVYTKNLKPAEPSVKEILRYAGVKQSDNEILSLIESCINEIKEKLSFRVCYRVLSVNINEDVCDFGDFKVNSKDLAKNLKDSEQVLIFASTIGIEIDRIIAKYSRISPSKALIFDALGAERIEALCDSFCEEFSKEKGVLLKPRFSAGYGDLPLTTQREIFSQLNPDRKIGLTLNESSLMSPSKSVTAFAGIKAGVII